VGRATILCIVTALLEYRESMKANGCKPPLKLHRRDDGQWVARVWPLNMVRFVTTDGKQMGHDRLSILDAACIALACMREEWAGKYTVSACSDDLVLLKLLAGAGFLSQLCG
jgi:hypothetical protein